MRTDYVNDDDLEVILALLMPQNRLVCQVALHTGLRIGDVVSLRTEQLKRRFTVREAKTGKSKRVSLSADLLSRIQAQAGEVWAFPSPSGETRTGHKTRQAVWADIKRAGKAMRLRANVAPHSLRKIYAVREYERTGDLSAVQKALNHDDPSVTMLYALADAVAARRGEQRGRKLGRP